MGESCAIASVKLSRNTERGTPFADEEWKKHLIHSLMRDFKKEGRTPKSLFVCSRHFEEKCILPGKRKVLVTGSMPTKFLPTTSHPVSAPTPRKLPSAREPPIIPERVQHLHLNDLHQALDKKTPDPWVVVRRTDSMIALYHDERRLRVEVDREFTVSISHEGRTDSFPCRVQKEGVRPVLSRISSAKLCCGLSDIDEFVVESDLRKITSQAGIVWAIDCSVTSGDQDICEKCKNLHDLLSCRKKSSGKPLSKHTPLKWITNKKLKKTLITQRQETRKLQHRIRQLQREKDKMLLLLSCR
ncbi:hypothetical protein CAPTEDRAFT_218498 [Capitella teleta]|uniref:THAP-type domain-containing protein n=1 Tax=Capitella teleta TaxID=283909 RepID=R7VIV7_CAPTE|nr:hypothetical protein CAPTEDRAFT_218498 [Capitella teleta]|eukprot:ELU18768.1 hypothetical protein CAPTEDRAFT_218498 [Capitella teleta]